MKRSHVQRNIFWLVVSNMFYFPFHIWDNPNPIDELIFFKTVIAPPNSLCFQILGNVPSSVGSTTPFCDFFWDSQVDIKHRTPGQFHRRIPVRNCSFVIEMNPFWLHNCCNLDRFMTNHGIILLIEGDSGSDANVQLSWVNCSISSLKGTKTWHEGGEESPINPYYPHEKRSGKSTRIIG